MGRTDIEKQADFCRIAEDCGLDSLLIAFGSHMPDPILLATALGRVTETIRFMIAYRSGLMVPTLFVQQLNTLSQIIGGRVALNIVAGHTPKEQAIYGDHLPHDERYDRTMEFLEVCHEFWDGDEPASVDGRYYQVENGDLHTEYRDPRRDRPEVYVGGGSAKAQELAAKHGHCWLRFAEAPSEVAPSARKMRQQGVEVGLRLSVIARPSRGGALDAAADLVAGAAGSDWKKRFLAGSDSVGMRQTVAAAESEDSEWLTPWLWTGAVATHGAPCISILGSPEEVADGFLAFRDAGISQFILTAWHRIEDMVFFGEHVLPVIRKKERETTKERQAT